MFKRKNNRPQNDIKNSHFRTWKKGKSWCYVASALAILALGSAGTIAVLQTNQPVHAETTEKPTVNVLERFNDSLFDFSPQIMGEKTVRNGTADKGTTTVNRTSDGLSMNNPSGVTGDVGVTKIDMKWVQDPTKILFDCGSTWWGGRAPFTVNFDTDKPLQKGQKVVIPLKMELTIFNAVSSTPHYSLSGQGTTVSVDGSYKYDWDWKAGKLTVTALNNANNTSFKGLQVFSDTMSFLLSPIAAVPAGLTDGGDIRNVLGTTGAGAKFRVLLSGQETTTTLTNTQDLKFDTNFDEYNSDWSNSNKTEDVTTTMRTSTSGWWWGGLWLSNTHHNASSILDGGYTTVKMKGVSNAKYTGVPIKKGALIGLFFPVGKNLETGRNIVVPLVLNMMNYNDIVNSTVISNEAYDAATNTISFRVSRKAEDWATFAKTYLSNSEVVGKTSSYALKYLQKMAKDNNAAHLMPYIQSLEFNTPTQFAPTNWNNDMKVDFETTNSTTGKTWGQHFTVKPYKAGEADPTKLINQVQTVDLTGKAIGKGVESFVLNKGDQWKYEPPVIPGYAYVSTNDSALLKTLGLPNSTTGVIEPIGTVTENMIGKMNTIVFGYTDQGTVTTHYVDTEGKALKAPVKTTGKNGTKPSSNPPASITNYYVKTTPVDVTPAYVAGKNIDVTYVYDNQAPITYSVIDEETGQTLERKKAFITGKLGQNENNASNQAKLKKIQEEYLKKGYTLQKVSNGELPAPTTKEGYDIEIRLGHRKDTTTSTKTIKQTIQYRIEALKQHITPPEANEQRFTFTNTQMTDKVTGKIVKDDWTAPQQTKAVPSPSVKGYTPSQTEISSKTITHNDQDKVFTVTYKAKASRVTVTYIDIDPNVSTLNKVLSQQTLNGKWGTTYDNTTAYRDELERLKTKGYALVKADAGAQKGTFQTENITQPDAYKVYLKHGTKQVKPQTPEHQKTITQTIRYVDEQGKVLSPSAVKTLHFQNEQTIDRVTGEVLAHQWDDGQKTPAVRTPSIVGYQVKRLTSDQAIATINPGSKAEEITQGTYNHDTGNQTITITFEKIASRATITYIDVDPHASTPNMVIGKQILDGQQGYPYDNTKAYQTELEALQAKGYALVKADVGASQGTFQTNQVTNPDEYYVYLKHTTTARASGVVKDIKQTIQYRDEKGQTLTDGTGKIVLSDNIQTLRFVQGEVVDNVTGKQLSTNWSAEQHTQAVETPNVKGYEVSQIKGAEHNAHATPQKVTAGTYNNTDKDTTITVTFKTLPAQIKVIFRDVDENTPKDKAALATQVINGKLNQDYDQSKSYQEQLQKLKEKGYVFVKADQGVDKGIFDKDQTILYVDLKHTTTVKTIAKTVTQTINYVNEVGQAIKELSPNVQKFVFTGTQTIDRVTGRILKTIWSQSQKSKAIKSPELKGYTVDVVTVKASPYTSKSKDKTIMVTYKALPKAVPTSKKIFPVTGTTEGLALLLSGLGALFVGLALSLKRKLK